MNSIFYNVKFVIKKKLDIKIASTNKTLQKTWLLKDRRYYTKEDNLMLWFHQSICLFPDSL